MNTTTTTTTTIRSAADLPRPDVPEAQEIMAKIRPAWAREELHALYWEHAIYVARAIKTAGHQTRDRALETFDDIIERSKCQEVFINHNSRLSLVTENHPLGQQANYLAHPKSGKVARWRRVRVAWFYTKWLLENAWDALEEYPVDLLSNNVEKIAMHCPYCNYRVVWGHWEDHDGRDVPEFDDEDCCRHVVWSSFGDFTSWREDLVDIVEEIEEHDDISIRHVFATEHNHDLDVMIAFSDDAVRDLLEAIDQGDLDVPLELHEKLLAMHEEQSRAREAARDSEGSK